MTKDTTTTAPASKDAAGNTTGETGITPEAFAGNADLAEKEQDRLAEIADEHEYKGPTLSGEEYDRIGKGKDYDPDARAKKQTLPGSTVAVPEGVTLPDQATVRTHRTTSRSIKTEDGD